MATAAAAALDPPAPRAGAATEHGTCANCGAYCSACGQKLHLHRSIGDAVHEMVHGILHLDGKLWNTLPLLATAAVVTFSLYAATVLLLGLID